MSFYQCRNCTAVFTDPRGPSCPACSSDGPTVYDASDSGNGYDNNWYEPVRAEVLDE